MNLIIAFMVSIAAYFIGSIIHERSQEISNWLIKKAAKGLPRDKRTEVEEQWLADSLALEGKTFKLINAIGCLTLQSKSLSQLLQNRVLSSQWVWAFTIACIHTVTWLFIILSSVYAFNLALPVIVIFILLITSLIPDCVEQFMIHSEKLEKHLGSKLRPKTKGISSPTMLILIQFVVLFIFIMSLLLWLAGYNISDPIVIFMFGTFAGPSDGSGAISVARMISEWRAIFFSTPFVAMFTTVIALRTYLTKKQIEARAVRA